MASPVIVDTRRAKLALGDDGIQAPHGHRALDGKPHGSRNGPVSQHSVRKSLVGKANSADGMLMISGQKDADIKAPDVPALGIVCKDNDGDYCAICNEKKVRPGHLGVGKYEGASEDWEAFYTRAKEDAGGRALNVFSEQFDEEPTISPVAASNFDDADPIAALVAKKVRLQSSLAAACATLDYHRTRGDWRHANSLDELSNGTCGGVELKARVERLQSQLNALYERCFFYI